MVYDRGSVGEMEPYLDLARSLSVAEARFIPLRSIGAAREHAERRPDQAAACEHLLEVLARRPELRSLLLRDYFTITATIFRFAAARTSCGIGRKVVFIDSDGAVYPCPNHVDEAHRAGRLTETPLARIVRGSAVMNAVRQRYQVRRFERCSTCPFRHWCAGDCRGEVVAATGDPAAPSPHCEELRRMYRRLLWLLADGDRRLEVAPSLPGGSATADAFR
jgi:uncharacterized protein